MQMAAMVSICHNYAISNFYFFLFMHRKQVAHWGIISTQKSMQILFFYYVFDGGQQYSMN